MCCISKGKRMYVNPNVWMYMIFFLMYVQHHSMELLALCIGTFQHNNVCVCKCKYFLCTAVDLPKNGLIALQTPRTSRLSTFYYCQVVNRA